MLKKLMSKMQNEEGQGLIEYALIVVLISVACVAALGALGLKIGPVFDQIAASI